ncbi:MAG: Type 1 glutamine amidotransferase-like domain-containing protein [Gaiellaceae bacterium]
MRERRRIFAMGGGGFAAPPGDPALDEYVLDVAERPNPRICLLPTAGGDSEDQVRRFYAAYRSLPCEPTHLSLFRLGTRPVDVRSVLLAQDIVYVGGGSLLNLLAVWRAHGLESVLRDAWERGVLLCGFSAGSMCWFRAGVTTSFGAPRPVPGLGFLPASNSVHRDSEPARLSCYREAVRTEAVPPGYAVADGVGLLFAGRDLTEAVSARADAGAVWVEEIAGEAVESPLAVELLRAREATTTLSIAEFREARSRRAAPNRPGIRRAGTAD